MTLPTRGALLQPSCIPAATVSAEAIEGIKLDPASAAKNMMGNGSESDRMVRTTEAAPTRETQFLDQMRYSLALQSWRTQPVTSLALMRHAESLEISLEPSALQAHALPIAILSYTAPLPANWLAIPAGEYKGIKYDLPVFENRNTGKVRQRDHVSTRTWSCGFSRLLSAHSVRP